MKTRLNLYRILPQKLSWNSGTLTWHSHLALSLGCSNETPEPAPNVHSLLRQKLSLCSRIVTRESIIIPSDFMSHPCPHLHHHLSHKFHGERSSSLCQAIFHQYRDVYNKQFGYLHSTGNYSLHQCPPGSHNCCSGMLYHLVRTRHHLHMWNWRFKSVSYIFAIATCLPCYIHWDM